MKVKKVIDKVRISSSIESEKLLEPEPADFKRDADEDDGQID